MTRRKASWAWSGFQVADVLAEEDLRPDGERHGVFQVRADSEDDRVADCRLPMSEVEA